jgi:hypothetical protein
MGKAAYCCSGPGTIGAECWGWIAAGAIALTLLTVRAPAHRATPLLHEHILHTRQKAPVEPSALFISQLPLSILPYFTSFSSPSFFSTLAWMLHPSTTVRRPLTTTCSLTATIARNLLLLQASPSQTQYSQLYGH